MWSFTCPRKVANQVNANYIFKYGYCSATMCLNRAHQEYGHPYLSRMGLGVDLRINTRKTCVENILG